MSTSIGLVKDQGYGRLFDGKLQNCDEKEKSVDCVWNKKN